MFSLTANLFSPFKLSLNKPAMIRTDAAIINISAHTVYTCKSVFVFTSCMHVDTCSHRAAIDFCKLISAASSSSRK